MMKIHITKQGESIDSIANTYAVSKQDLTGINPHVNLASDLVPGLKLKIPETIRTEKNEHIEKFFPNLDHEKFHKEQAVPIGLKPFETSHPPGHHDPKVSNHHTHVTSPETPPHAPESVTPWSHLGEHTTYLNSTTMHHHPWNHPFPPFSTYDTRVLIPPMPFYPSYPPYFYPHPYGTFPPFLPLPLPGFGYGHGFGHGWHGGGHHHHR